MLSQFPLVGQNFFHELHIARHLFQRIYKRDVNMQFLKISRNFENCLSNLFFLRSLRKWNWWNIRWWRGSRYGSCLVASFAALEAMGLLGVASSLLASRLGRKVWSSQLLLLLSFLVVLFCNFELFATPQGYSLHLLFRISFGVAWQRALRSFRNHASQLPNLPLQVPNGSILILELGLGFGDELCDELL